MLTKSTHTYAVNEHATLLKISRAVYKRMLLCGRIAACVGRLSALFRSPYLGSWEVDAIRELTERITIRRYGTPATGAETNTGAKTETSETELRASDFF